MAERDIGVPGAVAEALKRLRERVLPEQLDRVFGSSPRFRMDGVRAVSLPLDASREPTGGSW